MADTEALLKIDSRQAQHEAAEHWQAERSADRLDPQPEQQLREPQRHSGVEDSAPAEQPEEHRSQAAYLSTCKMTRYYKS